MASTRHVHAVRAETDQELRDHLRVRRAFVRDVVNDERTRRQLFAFWGHSYRIDAMVDLLIPILDRAADRADLPTRADFEDPAHFQTLVDAFPDVDDRLHLARGVAHIEEMLATSRPERWRQAQGFVVAVLYGTQVDEEVPIRAWLGDHLCTVFDVLVYGRLWDRPVQFLFSEPPRLAPDAPTGRRGKRSGPSLEDYAHWVYRLDVAEPRATEEQLAIERLHALGDPHRAGDRRGVTERHDTKTIRYGYEKAKRLLELTVPPEHWTAYFDEMWPDRPGKIRS